MILRPLVRAARYAIRDVMRPPVACAIQGALDRQRSVDMTDTVACPACGGLGVVADYSNRIETTDFDKADPEYTYGGKVCPDCGGRGF